MHRLSKQSRTKIQDPVLIDARGNTLAMADAAYWRQAQGPRKRPQTTENRATKSRLSSCFSGAVARGPDSRGYYAGRPESPEQVLSLHSAA